MLYWNHRPPRFFTGYAPFPVALGCLVFAIAPLAAQTEPVPDPSASVADTPPVVPAKPVVPETTNPPQTSAATIVSDSSQPTNTSTLSSSAGPTPNAGPGAGPESNLGSQLSAAAIDQKLPFRVTATIAEVYNNNIFSRPQKQGDFITRLGVRGEYRIGNLYAPDGNYFDLVYTPGLHVYARHSNETGVDQNVDALYGHHWTKLTLTLEQIYRETQQNNASVGGLVTADVFTTIAKAKFVYSPSIDVVFTGRQDLTSYDQPAYSDSKEWSGDLYALYHIDSKVSVGFGPRIGYINLDEGANATYQQVLARLIYDPYANMNFEGTVGGEDREYQSANRSDTLEPVFEFAGAYRPNPSTVLGLNASRQFQPSYAANGQDYIATNVRLSATQRFFQAYFVGFATGYENDDYENFGNFVGATREDNYFFFQPSVIWKPNGWLKVAAFDRYEEDSSNFDIFTYDTNQVGVSVSATY